MLAEYEPLSRPPKRKHASCGFQLWHGGRVVGAVSLAKKECLSLGRHPLQTDVCLDHVSISRFHAAVYHEKPEGAVKLVDIGSVHGTVVNGELLKTKEAHELRDGDQVRFGTSPIVYEYLEHIAALEEEGLLDAVPIKTETLHTKAEVKPKQRKERSKVSRSEKIRASHILVKHTGSRTPSSWREKKITRTKEEAMARIEAIREMVVHGGESFDKIAKKESDCSSAKRAGDLGFFTRGKMLKEFSNVAFQLKIGEYSGIVDSTSGLHFIKRTG